MDKNKRTRLTGIFLEKFQTIIDPTFIKLDKLTFLYGPNSAGKSSIIDALSTLSNFSRSKDKINSNSFKESSSRFSSKGLGPLNIGLEYLSGSNLISKTINDELERWWKTPPSMYVNQEFHQEFFEAIEGKKVQIQLGTAGTSISVAIEGEPLFEIKDQYYKYDFFLNRIEDGDKLWEHDALTERSVAGKLIFYKKNKFLNLFSFLISFPFMHQKKSNNFLTDFYKKYFDIENPFYKILVEENDNTIILNGITFDADRENLDQEYVSSWFGLNEMFNTNEEEILDSYFSFFKNEEKIEDFLNKYYSSGNLINHQKKMQQLIYEVSHAINSLVIGLRFEIADALKFSHVKGSREILNSELCFHYSYSKNFEIRSHLFKDENYMSSYAVNLAENNFEWRYSNYLNYNNYFGKNAIQFDFVNECFSKYLSSLKNYSIKFESGKLQLPENHPSTTRKGFINTPIYLYLLRNNMRYGFEDVGSGLSYIFPILTSLNSINFTLIEQPELHLHPASQCELGDVFLAAQHYGSVAVVESHSEHILLRILRRVKETNKGFLLRKELKTTENDFRIYYFDPQENGFTIVKEIRVDKHGELLNSWPGGFFSEREKELFGE